MTGVAAATALLLSGCGVSVEDLPLPGGEVDGPTYQLKAVFRDALNLPGKAKVRLGGVDIGIVESIETRNYVAHVVMTISKDVPLPKGTTAQLRQPTPLGDVFLAVEPPNGKLDGPKLANGATIPLSDTDSAATVEDSLAAATMLINGGGLGKLKNITRELNAVFDNGGKRLPHLIDEMRTTVRVLNERTADIDRLLTASNAVAKTINQRKGSIDTLLTEYPPAFDVLSKHTKKLAVTLDKVGDASGKTVKLTQQSRADLAAILRDLGPVLDGFNGIRGDLGPTLRDMVALGKLVERASEGESGAGAVTVDLTNVITQLVPTLPGLGGELPGQDDLQHGLESVTENITELIKRLGGG